jgi:hypothetical protein
MHEPQAQEDEQVRNWGPPQCSVFPAQHSQPSSQIVSQSSSTPLHLSSGSVQFALGGRPQLAVHVPVPAEPQTVVQGVECPAQQL